MRRMRHRFLLFAGWVAAVAVAIVVSSGAVSVAGGQVSDRPIRALSASEVAALPVAAGSERPAGSELPASGGSGSDGTSAAEATTASGPSTIDQGPVGGEQDALGDGSALSIEPAPTTDDDTPGILRSDLDLRVWAPSEPIEPEAPRSVARVADLRGGRVAYGGNDGRVLYLWAFAKPGYATLREMSFDRSVLTVVFSNGSRESTLVVSWTDTGLDAVEIEGDN